MSGATFKLNASNSLGGSPSSYFDNYAAQVGALDGSSGLDSDLMGPGGSVFNGGFSGLGGGFGGSYSLYNDPTTLAMTPEERMKYFAKMQKEKAIIDIETQKELNKIQWGAQVDQKHQSEVAEFQATAAEDVITRQCGILKDKIKENEQGHVAEEYTKLVQAVREKFAEAGYKNVDELQVRAYAEKLYYNATGVRLIEDIEKHSDSEFVTGLKQGASLGTGLFASNVSAKDNIAGINGGEVSGRDKASIIAGNLLGGFTAVVVLGVAALASVLLLKKGGGALLKKLAKESGKIAKSTEKLATSGTEEVASTLQRTATGGGATTSVRSRSVSTDLTESSNRVVINATRDVSRSNASEQLLPQALP